jgi:D-alanine-D-alanine ligase
MDKIFEKTADFPFRKKKKDIVIGVIAGGISSEREVSLSTGKGIFDALAGLGYRAKFIDFNGDVSKISNDMDIAYIALHGKYGEDGTVQGLLELLKIPYTGSGVLASAIAMDKYFAKKIFEFEKIPTPPFFTLELATMPGLKEIDRLASFITGYPLIAKPNRGGSTIGVSIIESAEEIQKALDQAFVNDTKVLMEKFIKGKLLTVSIIGEKALALPIIEIRPKSGFYDYTSKYTSGMTEYIVPSPIGEDTARKISDISLKCHSVLGCSGISRVDLILADNNEVNILEVNTIPGMTPTSLVPKAAAAAGIDFPLLVDIILNCASLKI